MTINCDYVVEPLKIVCNCVSFGSHKHKKLNATKAAWKIYYFTFFLKKITNHSDDVPCANYKSGLLSLCSQVGNYKRAVKRFDDGHRLCNDLMGCLQERAKIEKAYGDQLTGWSKRWRQLIEKGRRLL